MNDRIANDLIRYAELVEDGALISPEEMNCASLMRIAAEALAQPAVAEQHKQRSVSEHLEPVAWGNFKEDGTLVGLSQHQEDQANWVGRKPLYTTPPQRKPLTDEQIMDMYNEPRSDAEMLEFARAIEALAQPDRHELQAKGEHHAPCARFCEANAFRIAERGYQRQIEELQAKLAQSAHGQSGFFSREAMKAHSDGHVAQPEQEPVAYDVRCDNCGGDGYDPKDNNYYCSICEGSRFVEKMLYTTPQPKQEQRSVSEHLGEPVAWYIREKDMLARDANWVAEYPDMCEPLYTTPQQRKPLTDEQIMALLVELCVPTKYEGVTETFTAVVRTIEAAHGIRPSDFKEQL